LVEPHPINICLVAHFAYGALVGGTAGHIGGVERQTTLMGRWLAARGHRVSLVTWDEGQPDGVAVDGVRVFKVCRRDAGLPGLRFLHPRWTSLNRALARADADLYYHNCGEYVTGQVALWARTHGRRFVYSVASDPECDPRLPQMRTWRERVLFRYGLRHAHRIIVQTDTQARMLREGVSLASEVLPMPSLAPAEAFSPPSPPPPAGARVLWVGRVVIEKRPDRYLDLAEACPSLRFDLVGPGDGGAYSAEVLARAATLPNVTVHGAVAREKVYEFYRQAACLCSTSLFEGFPNTFLEAWGQGLPVVSTFDPDGLIETRGLGRFVKDVPGLARALTGLLEDPERWMEASRAARRYYVENHTVEAAMPRFEAAFLATVAPG
jgi:glycosyltransferase involved in cell wall biosynthesis